MSRTFRRVPLMLALLCGAAFTAPAFADTCLNTDKEKYAEGDARSYDYGKCKSTGPDNSYNSLNAIGQQMQGIMQRQESSSRREMSDSERDDLYARDRADYANARFAIQCEVTTCLKKPAPYPNAQIAPAQQQAIRSEIAQATAQGRLLETYGDNALAKKWSSGSDPAANWKMCEVGTALVKAYVYGEGAAQKDPAKGFAIARAGCDASCGGTCYELGRIFEGGDAVAPGVDKVLGKEPQKQTVFAYEVAAVNGITAVYERLGGINSEVPPRYKGKTYFDLRELDTYSYWLVSDADKRLAYRQFQKCLKADPANLTCVRGINALLADIESSGGRNFTLKSDVTSNDIAFYKDYQARLEALLAASAPAPTVTAP